MFANHVAAAIENSRSVAALDLVSKSIWQGLTAGAIGDEDAQRLAEVIHARRLALKPAAEAQGGRSGRPTLFPPRRPQRSPHRPASIARRRHLAASGPMPPALAARFTTGELAVLKIVADEVRVRGTCERPIDEIAARAGVCRTTVQNALRRALEGLLVSIEERRPTGERNLPNRVRIVAPEWIAWLKRGPGAKDRIGFKRSDPTDKDSGFRGVPKAPERSKKGPWRGRAEGGGFKSHS